MTDVAEPCVRCGEETAAGTFLFAGRRRIEQRGSPTRFLCEQCGEQLVASRSGKRLTDEEIRRIVDGGSAVMVTWTK